MTIKQVKKSLSWKDEDIAAAFGYKNAQCYRGSTRKEKIDAGIVSVYERVINSTISKIHQS